MNHSTQETFTHAIKKQKRNLLNSTSDLLQQLPQELGLADLINNHFLDHRERIYTPLKTLHLFLNQVLSADQSCQQAVSQGLVTQIVNDGALFSSNTAGYCKARQRLPTLLIERLSKRLGQWIHDASPTSWEWCGRAVKLVDGTTVSMRKRSSNHALV